MDVAQKLVTVIFLSAVALAGLAVLADPCGAYSPRRGVYYREALEAQAEARAAARAAAKREAAREREARRVRKATARYSELYGSSVGRWVRLARKVGWSWAEMPTLMRIVYGESRGYPGATNGQYRGLMQHGSYWYASYWHFDPYAPRQSLKYGLKLKRLCGWHSWSVY